MPMYVPQELLDFIAARQLFFIVGHKEPDGDCVSSELALSSALCRLGKVAYPCSAGPFTRPDIASFENRFQDSIPPELKSMNAAVIVVDCSNIQRTGRLEDQLRGLSVAVIDHHSASDAYGDLTFIDAKAPSVSFMIFHVIEALGLKLTKEEAELLFFGLCTDTGYFRHLDLGTERVFEVAAKLVAAGASPKRSFSQMYGGKSFNSRKLMGQILARAESHFGGRLLISWETLEDSEQFGLESRDSDMLYQLFQSVSGCEAIVVIRQESVGNCTVGFRSRDAIDVGAVAASFGGGGHKNAAGLSIPGTILQIRERILDAFSPLFHDDGM
jgi:bifunctional oligoribonuclease and PAP phosphatase NrnA